MKRIISDDNPTYKAAIRLKQKKYRDEQKKYLVEGPNLIREAMQNGGEIEVILQSEAFRSDDLLREKIDPVQAHIQTVAVPAVLFQKLSDTETPQGIMAVVRKKVYSEEEFFSSGLTYNEKAGQGNIPPSNIIVLDRLQDPGNIGTILRTADAAGYQGAILLKGTADIYSPKIVRAAAGSLFRLPVLMADQAGDVIALLRRHKKNILCTAPGGSRFYYEIDMKTDAAVVIGNEGNGVSEEFVNQSDILVKIPMEGTIESLNAAVSAGILMYESVRQRYQEI